MNRRWMTFALAAVGAMSVAHAQSANTPDLKQQLLHKTAENRALADKARDITMRLGTLASSGKLPTDDEAISIMRKMVEELASIQEQLKHQDEEIAALYKGTGIPMPKQEQPAKSSAPSIDSRLSALERVKFSGYEQFQYRNSEKPGSTESAFYDKRTRINMEVSPDKSMVGFKASFDLAGSSSTGGTTKNDTNGVLTKDAYVHYLGAVPGNTTKVEAWAGQFSLPLGYELGRSDADREMPERSLFNDALMKGQRGRGLSVATPIGGGLKVQAGIIDSLTTEDPEQLGFAPGGHGRLAGIASVTGTKAFGNKSGGKTTVEYGVSGLSGSRPAFANPNLVPANAAISPAVDRRYGYAHLNFLNLFGKGIDWRNEVAVATDRVPSATPNASANATHMSSVDTILGYRKGIHRIDLRYNQFNPNLNVYHKTQSEIEAAYNMFLGNYRITFAREQVTDESLANKYNITTVRLQFKY